MWQHFPCKVVPNCSESTVKSIGDITIVPRVKHIHSVKSIVSSIFFNYLFILWDGNCWERGVLSQLFPPCISCFVFVFCVHSFWEYFSSVIFDDVVSMFLHSIHSKPLLLSWSYRRFIWFFCCANISFEIFPCPGICSYFRRHRVLSLVFCGIS